MIAILSTAFASLMTPLEQDVIIISTGRDHINQRYNRADSERPVFRGIMELSKAESQLASMRPTLFFRITRQGGEGWRLTMDD